MALLLSCLIASACQEDETTPTTESAASLPAEGASDVDPQNPCTIPSASPEHVAQALGTGRLTGPTLLSTGRTQKCQYTGADDIGDATAIELDLNATELDFDYARRQVEQYFGGSTSEVPGFGDRAFSHTMSSDVGRTPLVLNTLCVLEGDVLVFITSEASFEQIRALESDVLRDLGA